MGSRDRLGINVAQPSSETEKSGRGAGDKVTYGNNIVIDVVHVYRDALLSAISRKLGTWHIRDHILAT